VLGGGTCAIESPHVGSVRENWQQDVWQPPRDQWKLSPQPKSLPGDVGDAEACGGIKREPDFDGRTVVVQARSSRAWRSRLVGSDGVGLGRRRAMLAIKQGVLRQGVC
jgi:hypothetical protein